MRFDEYVIVDVTVTSSFLFQYGEKCINVVNSSGDTLLHTAVKENQTNMVNALLEYGATSETENGHRLTAPDCALVRIFCVVISYLH